MAYTFLVYLINVRNFYDFESLGLFELLFKCLGRFTLFYAIFSVLIVILHELGHLIFGLLNGFSFLQFRIFSRAIIKKDGKYNFKKQRIAGTWGQCLMKPPLEIPDGSDYKKYIIYFLGGIINQFILLIISILGYFLVDSYFIKEGLIIGIYVNLLIMINQYGLSFRTGDLNLVIDILHNHNNAKGVWFNLDYVWKTFEGKNYKYSKKMIDELLDICDNDVERLVFSTKCAIDASKYEKEFELNKVYKIISELYEKKGEYEECISILAYLIAMEFVLDKNEYLKLYDDKLAKKFALTSDVNCLNALIGYELLINKDEKKAQKYINLFERMTKMAPITFEVDKKILDAILKKTDRNN